MYKILDKINTPNDIKGLNPKELNALCAEIREFLIDTVTKTGGHLASNLGIVELTVALESVLDLSKDKLIWDVGHQSYVHKILTGRKDKFGSLRQYNGISGFPKTSESEYDCFNTGHSSTSVSAAVGMARARDIKNEKYKVCAVFGDGALTGGMIYEALNDVGHRQTPLMLILNDNEMSISKNVGALSKYLLQLRQTSRYHESKRRVENALNNVPVVGKSAIKGITHVKDTIRQAVLKNNFFDDLGIKYLGPVDGHDIESLINVLTIAKNINEPVLVHVITKKGKGYLPAEENPQNYHAIPPKSTGETRALKYKDHSQCFGDTITALAKENKDFVAVTAAMRSGVGLSKFCEKYPDRFFDVGIAEEHAVTFSAGLSKGGITPVFAVYSSFFQRSYDQLLHDICLQNLHAVFMVDRAGIVGADGETHHGMHDIAFLSSMPNMTVLSPSAYTEFEEMIKYAICSHNGPIAIRYPKGQALCELGFNFEIGKYNVIGNDLDNILITSGRMTATALNVQKILSDKIKIIELPTVYPLPKGLIDEIKGAKHIFTLEDHGINGGIGTAIGNLISKSNISITFLPFAFPEEAIIHGSVNELDKHYSLDCESISDIIKKITE